ncbi:hypothetical protein ACFO1B_53015 [Dactylosporangium siamense]|uniref:hypothetical protein n=1 Tax=Dactylosporangium siamense TaxID=685454 RepID=UPI001940A08C|nr:hypothetical protein [Dactylosporangium siamense]
MVRLERTRPAGDPAAGPLIPTRRRSLVADLWFVLLTIAAFAILGLAVRAVERL